MNNPLVPRSHMYILAFLGFSGIAIGALGAHALEVLELISCCPHTEHDELLHLRLEHITEHVQLRAHGCRGRGDLFLVALFGDGLCRVSIQGVEHFFTVQDMCSNIPKSHTL